MKTRMVRIAICLLTACLCTVLLLTGCSRSGSTSGSRDTAAASREALGENTSGRNEAVSGKTDSSGSAEAESVSKDARSVNAKFASGFKTVESNPIPEEFRTELWLATKTAMENEASGADASGNGTDGQSGSAGTSASAVLSKLAGKRIELVKKDGIHYTEVASVMGMDIPTEYWIRDGKYKKIEADQVFIFDGKNLIQYKPEEKTGTRFGKDMNSAGNTLILDSMLPSLAASPFEQKEDKKLNGFDCNVFFLDIEVMGMKGNTLYVDKNTGMLIKYQVGDEKKGMVNTITKFEVGGFDDSVFKVPADIKLQDYKN